ncbi:MAG: ankyrin repeat domain-containing protein [Gemmatimonas sp.]
MDTLPLPPQPSLEQYRKRAKSLVAATKSGNEGAVRAWASEWLQSLASALDIELTPFVRGSMERAVGQIEGHVIAARALDAGNSETRETSARNLGEPAITLATAHHLLAAAHGFESWALFVRHLEQRASTGDALEFERAADAVVNGDTDALRTLLHDKRDLVRAHSTRVHHATLLHYVAANGVEDFRQKTPPNAVEIALLLLRSGAEPDALADTYGCDYYQTTMNLLVSSTHPADAGLQSKLVEALLDYGAAINGVAGDESPLFTALDFGYRDAAETLARRGARVGNVVNAAALGDLDFVQRAVVSAVTLRPDIPLIAPPWRKLEATAKPHIELALAWACKFGRTSVAEFLIALGVDPAAMDGSDMTALHWAAATGMTSVVDELLRRGAPLEVLNAWEGTVLGSTMHFAVHDPAPGVDYVRMVERLIAAGANVNAVWFPSGNAAIDEALRTHGARAH